MPQIVVGAGFIAWAVAVAAVAVPRPQLARALLASLFALMGLVNLVAALTDPGVYQDAYGATAWIPAYRDVINGFWAANDAVLVLLSAAAQLLLAAAVMTRGRVRTVGLVGMVVFLVLVAPTAKDNLINLVFALGAVLLIRSERLARRAAAEPAVEQPESVPGDLDALESDPVDVPTTDSELVVEVREPAEALR